MLIERLFAGTPAYDNSFPRWRGCRKTLGSHAPAWERVILTSQGSQSPSVISSYDQGQVSGKVSSGKPVSLEAPFIALW